MKHRVEGGPEIFEICVAMFNTNVTRKNFLVFGIEFPEIPGPIKFCKVKFFLKGISRKSPHIFELKGSLIDDVWLQKTIEIESFEYSTKSRSGWIIIQH